MNHTNQSLGCRVLGACAFPFEWVTLLSQLLVQQCHSAFVSLLFSFGTELCHPISSLEFAERHIVRSFLAMTSTAEEPAAKGDHAKQYRMTVLAAHARRG